MCGVAAAIGRPSVDVPRIVQGMTDAMGHRGIRRSQVDSFGRFKDVGSVGHVRLPIVGLGEENDQPVEQDGWVVGFVGELLNFRDFSPEADCDVRTVVDTWTVSGARGFSRFDGFWSVVALNTRDNELHVLVDYLAQKPVYYRVEDEFAAVASELDAVALVAPVTPDWVYMSSVVKWGYCPDADRTPYAEVKKMVPGEHRVFYRDLQSFSYVADPLVPSSCSRDELKAAIVRATRVRVESSDVRIAALVSGGLDSSIVWTLAKRYGDVRVYHADNDEDDNLSRLGVLGATKISHSDVSVEKALSYMQEPVDLGSLFPQVSLSDGIGRSGGERVCLTGDGADELFGGYGRSQRYDSQWSDVFHELPRWHLPRLDRVMMRNRVEVRSPFLARDVVEMALGTGLGDRTGKLVLREIFRSDLPEGVADVPKKPLKTSVVDRDRESWSKTLVESFLRRFR